MRVVQLIDSLQPGGAERIAVTFVNALETSIDGSYLAVTRTEGPFKKAIRNPEHYIFLKKKHALDLAAVWRFRKFLKKHRIEVIHAHTTSFFFAVLTKWLYPRIRVVWHEHLGKRVASSKSDNRALVFCSRFFHRILTVNQELKEWCEKHLKTKQVHYLPNFVEVDYELRQHAERSKTIVSLANLKAPKNHLNLLRAFNEVHVAHPEWSLRLIGTNFNDDYAQELAYYTSDNSLEEVVEFVGPVEDVPKELLQAKIGVLSSDHEGLPMALLEYGASGLTVVATQVGQCEEVISNFGKVSVGMPNKRIQRS